MAQSKTHINLVDRKDRAEMLGADKSHLLIESNFIGYAKTAHSIKLEFVRVTFITNLGLPSILWQNCVVFMSLSFFIYYLIDNPLVPILIFFHPDTNFCESMQSDTCPLLNIEEAPLTDARLLRVHMVVDLLCNQG